ncbi:LivH Branched-chain amino acid ABC-type transport system, permease components [Burkholderiaceae bacterium]
MQLIFFLEQVLNGLMIGGYYLLIALGLSLIFSLGGIVNLAHGAFYALGAYGAVVLTQHVGFGGALVLSPVLVGLLGIAFERLLLRRFYQSDPILGLLLTFGLAMIAEQVIRMIWGSSPLAYSIPSALKGQIVLGDFIYSRYRMVMLLVVIGAMIGLWFLLNKTAFGRVVRAGTQRPDMVAVLGIRLNHYMTGAVVLGVSLAALAGVLLAPLAGVHPAMGAEIMTAAFVVVVIGGMGSFWGVVLAAVLVGVVRGITTFFYPPASEASMYVLMILVLLLRPRGLLGERIERFE